MGSRFRHCRLEEVDTNEILFIPAKQVYETAFSMAEILYKNQYDFKEGRCYIKLTIFNFE